MRGFGRIVKDDCGQASGYPYEFSAPHCMLVDSRKQGYGGLPIRHSPPFNHSLSKLRHDPDDLRSPGSASTWETVFGWFARGSAFE